jgi:hypothetical protein
MAQGTVKSGIFEAGSECRVLNYKTGSRISDVTLRELYSYCPRSFVNPENTLRELVSQRSCQPTFRRSLLPSLPAEAQEMFSRSGPTPRTNFFPSESIFNRI